MAVVALVAAGCGGASGSTTGVHSTGTVTTPTDHRPSASVCAGATSSCRSDADCAAGTACACDTASPLATSTPTACLPANCRVDADCASGYCSESHHRGGPGNCGAEADGFFCHTAADECGNDGDCVAGGTMPYAACMYAREVGHWVCVGYDICAG
jgi:hypothetical protein